VFKVPIFKAFWLFIVFIVTSSVAIKTQASDIVKPSNLQLVGKAKLSFLWWHVYDSELRTQTGRYEKGINPLILKLTYKRKISQEELIDETESQWKKFKLEPAQKKKWLQQLSSIWPSVKKNDVLEVYLDKHQYAHFFFNEKLIGSLEDTQFSYYFLAIWLGEKSAYPKLTRALTGKNK